MGAHIPAESVDSSRSVAVPMVPGDVVIFHSKTVHSALPNASGRIRWSIDFRYNPLEQPGGRPAFPGFVARSRRHPERELTDPHAWAQLWRDCRKRLARSGEPVPARF